MTGIELIAKERQEQIEKHGRTVAHDVRNNKAGQLAHSASCLASPIIDDWDARYEAPTGWNLELWQKMHDKSYHDRLILAGALIAAELDRINADPNFDIEHGNPHHLAG